MQLQITKNDIINKFPVKSDISSVTAPYLSFNNEYFLNLKLSQEADYNFKINNKYFKVMAPTGTKDEQTIDPVNSDDWSLQFTLGTVESEVLFSNIPGFSDKDIPSLEDFYGEDYDNQGRHLEIRYLGTQGNLIYAPDGVPVPNGCSSDEEVAATLNPDGIADYNPDAENIVFSSGSAGTKVYMLVYHSEPFNS